MKLRLLTKGRIWMVGLMTVALVSLGLLVSAVGQDAFFEKSLHYTGEGMRSCYEDQHGFMSITGIPYKDLDCKSCHVQSCDPCHAEKKGETCSYSSAKAKQMETCLPCHSRAGLTFRLGKGKGTLDVHVAAGMGCADCHKGQDVHGDGMFFHSMREPKALKVACVTCHATDQSIEAHTVHGDKVDCAACHVENTVACLNCHFDTFLETKSRKGTFFPMQDWLLLINHEGKVTSGTAMTLVYDDKKFVVYAPYYTHAIQSKGRACSDCHDNAAMKLVKQGKQIPMAEFKDGKMVTWKGVAPISPDSLKWVYLNKKGDTWMPIESDAPARIQWWWGTPLSEKQMEKLGTPY
jgi:hypothetical protein